MINVRVYETNEVLDEQEGRCAMMPGNEMVMGKSLCLM